MRKSEAFTRGKEDGRSGKEPSPVGGKVAYFTGYNIGRSEWNQLELTRRLSEGRKDQTP